MSGDSVLIIEDDTTLLRGLKDNFELRGYHVRTAGDGEAGLLAALSGNPDLVVLDIMLPKLNGFELCQQIRDAELDMPIIMLTAKGQEEDIVRGLNLGADDYMTKPFSIRELLARSGAFLRRRKAAVPETYVFGDFKLDLRSHRLFCKDEELALSPKEFRLLELFVRQAGRALTRDEILRSVWGSDILVTSRSVDRCVTTLRSKIEPNPRQPRWIQTIRDVGYRFEPSEDDTEKRANLESRPESSHTLPAGTRLGPYAIRSPLGSGGMGEVYRAFDPRQERDVAIKVLPQRLARSPNALARFQRETKAIATLSHPAILAIYDIGTDDERSYAVMELLEGETLKERLGRGSLDWRQAVRIGIAVAEGLSAAHAKDILHRDIKPSNLFLTEGGEVKLLDFGLAKVDDPASPASSSEATTLSRQTAPGTVLGTAGYMSPEQIRGRPTDARSDIFSLSCVIYEMITGSGPFERPTVADSLAAALRDKPDLSSLPVEIPLELQRIVEHGLEGDPDRRFQSARDLAFALEGTCR